ncbi:protein kinase subdomain-containing protein PKL [Coprinopsis sp. MPI-PUGE-AT-0042]|nr:protein kinase subdomain-containing protein PKL [Coprinopsis sp. MPI-PUGE-AT-0042]
MAAQKGLKIPMPSASATAPFHFYVLRVLVGFVPLRIRRWAYSMLVKNGGRREWTIHPGIYKLPLGLVLKESSFDTQAVEGAALRFLELAAICGVSHPLLFDVVSVPVDTGAEVTTYTITTFVQGDCASDVYDALTRQDWTRLEMDLREQLDALRLQTSQKNRQICNATGGIPYDPRFSWVSQRQLQLNTPQEFFAQVWTGLNLERNRNTIRPVIQPLMDRDVGVCFCHGDLNLRNFIFPGGLEAWRKGGSRLCLIDWEYAGWMPEPWDAIKSILTVEGEEDPWFPFVKQVFPAYEEYVDVELLWRSKAGVMII